jgi:hypothetical protein
VSPFVKWAVLELNPASRSAGCRPSAWIGLFVGPVIMAARLAVWREWIDPPPHPKI